MLRLWKVCTHHSFRANRSSHLSVFNRANSSIPNGGLLSVYKAKVTEGGLTYDDKQYSVLRYLSRLCDHMNEESYRPAKLTSKQLLKAQSERVVSTHKVVHHPALANRGKQDKEEESELAAASASASVNKSDDDATAEEHGGEGEEEPVRTVKGVYVYGEVGTGKTMAMDLFFDSVHTSHKRRVHFHQFMLEIHARIRAYKQELLARHGRSVNIDLSEQGSERDAIAHVAHLVSQEAHLLCFDEFQVTDIADAMILRKFFDTLWDNGTVLVATSNRPPDDLYKNGLNRSYFEPFVDRMKTMSVVRHIDSITDYRMLSSPTEDSYVTFTPSSTSLKDSKDSQDSEDGNKGELSEDRARALLWRKFIAIGNDDPLYAMGTATDTFDSNSDSDSNTKENNYGYLKKPFSMVVPIMMGRTLIADSVYPKTSRGLMLGPGYENNYQMSLHHTDRLSGKGEGGWATEKSDSKGEKSEKGDKGVKETKGSVDVDVDVNKGKGAFRGVGWFSFKFLCEQDRGASDYQALCSQFDTIFIEGIPRLSVLEHDKARRFIVLVDTLYDSNIRLFWSAGAPPGKLFKFLSQSELGEAEAADLLDGASFGTDHKWVQSDYKVDSQYVSDNEARKNDNANNTKVDSDSSIDGHTEHTENALRGAEQRAVSFQVPSDSNNENKESKANKNRDMSLSGRVSQSDSCVYNYTAIALDGTSTSADGNQNENENDAENNDNESGLIKTSNNESPVGGVDAAQDELKILEGELASVQELAFAFRRAGSRLTEMAGSRWQNQWRDNWGK